MKIKTYLLAMVLMLQSLALLHAQKAKAFKAKVIYNSRELVITQISPNCFEHTSYLQTNDFGNVPCNGLIVRDSNEVLVFDTPANDQESALLINWITGTLRCRIKAVVPTHFHNDCLGGLGAFHARNIPSYAHAPTIDFATEQNYAVPQHGFADSLSIQVGSKHVIARFWGEGHTRDNIIGYFPAEQVMFGGCLIKEVGANKGYLGDANVDAWPETVSRIRAHYPAVRLVVPGHGAYGGKKLLDYTIRLFSKTPAK